MNVTIVRLIWKVKLKPTILSNFQERTAHLQWFSIAIILIKVNGAHFPPDADSFTSVEDAEAYTQPPTVSITSQLHKLGKTQIKLDRIINHTKNYPDYFFIAWIQITLFLPLDYPGL